MPEKEHTNSKATPNHDSTEKFVHRRRHAVEIKHLAAATFFLIPRPLPIVLVPIDLSEFTLQCRMGI
jgi:hypothetical protein